MVRRLESDGRDRWSTDSDVRGRAMGCVPLRSISGEGEPADVRSTSVPVGSRVFVADCRTVPGSPSSLLMDVTIG